MWVGPNSTVCWWNDNFKFCCHKTMFTQQALRNSGQNKCRQLLIALKPLFVLDVLQRMIFDFCQCHVGCRRSNKQFIWKSAWVQCLSGPSCYKSGWVRTQKNTASSPLTVARCFINRAPVLSLGQRKSTSSHAENTAPEHRRTLARTYARTDERTDRKHHASGEGIKSNSLILSTFDVSSVRCMLCVAYCESFFHPQ